MPKYDLLIKDGRVLDGSGNPWFRADIGINDGKICFMGEVGKSHARHVIQADDRYVSPGFIDIHSHSDLTLLIDPRADNRVRQGITTEVNGNCGLSMAPVLEDYRELLKEQIEPLLRSRVVWEWSSFGEYLDVLEAQGVGLNVVPLVGHGTVRLAVMGIRKENPSIKELSMMKGLVAASLEEGARGLSTGLVYPPGCFAQTEEIVELTRVTARYGGIYASHIRGERETIYEALQEAIQIGEATGVSVQISHNCPKFGARHSVKDLMSLYEQARGRGLEITLDNDAHTDFEVRLSHALPQWVYCSGMETLLNAIRNEDTRNRITKETRDDERPGFGPISLLKHDRWERIVILRSKRKELLGRSIDEIAKQRGADPFATYLDLILEENDGVEALFDYIELNQVRELLCEPLMMICSDGQVRPRAEEGSAAGAYSPCSYGEYPYVLERFVREEKLLSIQEAVRKMTSFPAQKVHLYDRGLIRPGMWADLVIFDLERVKDRATCLYPYSYPLKNFPHRYPEGIDHVIINGVQVIDEGEQRDVIAGKVLRRL